MSLTYISHVPTHQAANEDMAKLPFKLRFCSLNLKIWSSRDSCIAFLALFEYFTYRQPLTINEVSVIPGLHFASSQPFDKPTDHLQLRSEYQNRIIPHENGKSDLFIAVSGSDIDDLGDRVDSKYTIGSKNEIEEPGENY